MNQKNVRTPVFMAVLATMAEVWSRPSARPAFCWVAEDEQKVVRRGREAGALRTGQQHEQSRGPGRVSTVPPSPRPACWTLGSSGDSKRRPVLMSTYYTEPQAELQRLTGNSS